jgi:hypothetical protein
MIEMNQNQPGFIAPGQKQKKEGKGGIIKKDFK